MTQERASNTSVIIADENQNSKPSADKNCNGCKWLLRESVSKFVFWRCVNFANGDWCGRVVGRPTPSGISDKQIIQTPAWCYAGKEAE